MRIGLQCSVAITGRNLCKVYWRFIIEATQTLQWVPSLPGGRAPEAWCWPPTPHLVRGSRKYRTLPLLPLWAFVSRSRVNFTIYTLRNGVFLWSKITSQNPSTKERNSALPWISVQIDPAACVLLLKNGEVERPVLQNVTAVFLFRCAKNQHLCTSHCSAPNVLSCSLWLMHRVYYITGVLNVYSKYTGLVRILQVPFPEFCTPPLPPELSFFNSTGNIIINFIAHRQRLADH
jgi:hypothetical protein